MKIFTIQMVLDCLIDIEAHNEEEAIHKYNTMTYEDLISLSHDINENACIYANDTEPTGNEV